MRTSGVMPTGSAATQICAAASSEIVQCSISMKNASNPHESAIIAISAVRANRVAMHSATSPRAMRSCMRLVAATALASVAVAGVDFVEDTQIGSPIMAAAPGVVMFVLLRRFGADLRRNLDQRIAGGFHHQLDMR